MTKGQFKANICSASLGKWWNKRLWHLIQSCCWFCCHSVLKHQCENPPHQGCLFLLSWMAGGAKAAPTGGAALPGSSSHAEAGLHHIKPPKMQLWSLKPSCWHLSPLATSMGRIKPVGKNNCNPYFQCSPQKIFLSDFCILIWQADDVKNISTHTMLAIPCLCLLPCLLESEVPLPSSEQSMML